MSVNTQEVEKERILGQVPVILHGLPTGPEVDKTGLPSYLTSFTSEEVSVENAIRYEQEALSFKTSSENDTTAEAQGSSHEQQQEDATTAGSQVEAIVEALALPTYEDTLSSTTRSESKQGHHRAPEREP